MTINERFAEILKSKNISVKEAAILFSKSEVYIRKLMRTGESFGIDPVLLILNSMDDISAEWLLTGRGEMLKSQSGMGESVSNVIQGNHNSNNVQHIAESDRREVDHLKEIIRMKDALLKCKESENELLRAIIKKKEGHE